MQEDTIIIENLRFETILGIYDWEREVPQQVVMNVAMGTDILPAAVSRDVQDTLDYAAVAMRIESFVQSSQFLLVETLVEETAQMVLREFAVTSIKLSCKKTQVMANADGVGVEIFRNAITH